jgi:hypothetical protein
VTDHGTIQPVLRHDGTASPALLRFAPFRPSVLEPDLRTQRDTVVWTSAKRCREIQVYISTAMRWGIEDAEVNLRILGFVITMCDESGFHHTLPR